MMAGQQDALGIRKLIADALSEDIGTGDVTTSVCVSPDANAKGYFIAKEAGVICGIELLSAVFTMLDERVHVTPRIKDGDTAEAGETIAEIRGPARAILTGERTALNFIRHLSGIATQTSKAVRSVAGTKTQIIDTRKTTPGLRLLEKYAVRCGGGKNHRFGLSDGILIKDNHIVAAGGIKQAVEKARQNAPHTLKIEVETESTQQIDEALSAGADIIMLDNMSNQQMTDAVGRIGGRALTEASGNMGDKDLRAVAGTGVSFISIGALTHSVKALDISLKLK
jgi:nicotinate-nucleotide pyrophosphorylase (carboxylating)